MRRERPDISSSTTPLNRVLNVLFVFCIFLIVAFFTGLHSLGDLSRNQSTPKVTNGFIDLTSWDFNAQGSYKLNGDWHFYWQQLLTPQDFIKEDQSYKDIIFVPSSWSNKDLPMAGYATYRVLVKMPRKGQYGLATRQIETAYKIWVNGSLLKSVGSISKNEESSDPIYEFSTIFFDSETEIIDIVIQVSNFEHIRGGIKESIEIGPVQKIASSQLFTKSLNYSIIAIMALAGFHALLLFRHSLQQKYIYFSALCFFTVIYFATLIEPLLYATFPSLNWQLHTKIICLSFIGPVWAYLRYSSKLLPTLFENQFTTWVSNALISMLIPIFILNIIQLKLIIDIVYILIFISLLYSIVRLSTGVMRNEDQSVRTLISFLFLIIGTLHDVYFISKTGAPITRFLPFCAAIFLILHYFFLADEHALALSVSEKNRADILSDKNKAISAMNLRLQSKTEDLEAANQKLVLKQAEQAHLNERLKAASEELAEQNQQLQSQQAELEEANRLQAEQNLQLQKQQVELERANQLQTEQNVQLQQQQVELEKANRLQAEQNDQLQRQQVELAEANRLQTEQYQQLQEKQKELEVLNQNLLQQTKRLEETQRLLWEQERLKGAFLDIAAYEFHKPLQAIQEIVSEVIKGNVGNISAKVANSLRGGVEALWPLERTLANIRTSLELQEEEEQEQERGTPLLLTDESGTAKSQEKSGIPAISLWHMVEAVMNPIAAMAAPRGLVFVNEVPKTGCLVACEETALFQILDNLIINAVRFTHEGTIKIGAREYPAGQIQVFVQDSGIGIPSHSLEGIFHPQFHANETISRHYGGLGLGLYVTKRLIEKHGGKIFVLSQVRVGSTFTFTLPCGDVDAQIEQLTINLIAREPYKLPSLQSMKRRQYDLLVDIILFDEDKSVLASLTPNFEAKMFNVSQHGQASAAVEDILSRKRPPSILIADFSLVRQDDGALLRKLRTRFSPETLPVILLVNKPAPEEIEWAATLGANAFLRKPINKPELSCMVEMCLALTYYHRLGSLSKKKYANALMTIRLNLSRIACVEASGGGVNVYYDNIENFSDYLQIALAEVERQFHETRKLIKIGRSHLVNPELIKSLIRSTPHSYQLVVRGKNLPIDITKETTALLRKLNPLLPVYEPHELPPGSA